MGNTARADATIANYNNTAPLVMTTKTGTPMVIAVTTAATILPTTAQVNVTIIWTMRPYDGDDNADNGDDGEDSLPPLTMSMTGDVDGNNVSKDNGHKGKNSGNGDQEKRKNRENNNQHYQKQQQR